MVQTVKTKDFEMDYIRFGHGEDTLVVLPGLSVQSVMLSEAAIVEAYQPLTDDYTLYFMDYRKEVTGTYTIYDRAMDVTTAIKELGLTKINLFGVSMGGMVSLTIATEYPKLVKKLVLGSTTSQIGEDECRMISKWASLAKEGNATDVYLAFGEAVYPQEVFEKSKDLFKNAAKTVTRAELEKFVIMCEGVKGFNVSDKLEAIECPVLVLGASDDKVLGAGASLKIEERLKSHNDCEIHMYDGYGHAAYDLAPDYKERILSFLKS